MTAESPAGLPAGHRDAAVAGRAGTAALRKPNRHWQRSVEQHGISRPASGSTRRADRRRPRRVRATIPRCGSVVRRLRHSAVGLILVGRLSGRPGSVSWPWLSIWPMAVRGGAGWEMPAWTRSVRMTQYMLSVHSGADSGAPPAEHQLLYDAQHRRRRWHTVGQSVARHRRLAVSRAARRELSEIHGPRRHGLLRSRS